MRNLVSRLRPALRRRPGQPRADLNVTPLIDVLLVLLIIFIAALPLTQKGMDATLPPQVQPHDTIPPPSQIVLEYSADRRLSINSQSVRPTDLDARLRDIFSTRTDRTLFVNGAGSLRYADIIQVIDAARGAGVTRVGIITEGMIAR